MSEELKLTLPERKPPAGRGTGFLVVLLVCVLAVGLANLALQLAGGDEAPGGGAPMGTSKEDRKALALKLEKQGLDEQAAAAWEAYLGAAKLDGRERSSIWYRVGKLYQDEGRPAEALVAYYRSEQFGEDEDWSTDLGRRVEECLENLGKFAALRYELAERVGLDESASAAGDEVVAEIGPQRITMAELDRRIEAEIERQLAQFAAYMPEEDRKAQKEQLLKGLSAPEERLRFLSQMVTEEILYRRARESRVAEAPEVRDLLLDMERRLLAQKVIEQEMSEQIKITSGDVETYYEAHKAEYVRPERARIAHILLDTEEAAEKGLARVREGEAFDAVCAELSLDEETKDSGGALGTWIEKGRPAPLFGNSAEAYEAIFGTAAGEVVARPLASEKGFHVVEVREREREVQRGLDEVKQEVFMALRGRKEVEVQERLLNELRETYDVVIHRSQFGAAAKADDGTQ